MGYIFTCKCPDRTIQVELHRAWEVWAVDDDGELGTIVDSGGDWDSHFCADCFAEVENTDHGEAVES